MEDKNRGLEDYSMFLRDDRWYFYRFHVDFFMGVTPSSQNAPGFNLQFSLSSTLGKISQINPQLPPEKCWCTSKWMKKKTIHRSTWIVAAFRDAWQCCPGISGKWIFFSRIQGVQPLMLKGFLVGKHGFRSPRSKKNQPEPILSMKSSWLVNEGILIMEYGL